MRRVIALLGLVTVEKIDVAIQLAHQFPHATLIDNINRMTINPQNLPDSSRYLRVTHDLNTTLMHTSGDLIIAFSENDHPESQIALLDDLQKTDVTIIALIDNRTCDCFPELRQILHAYADIVLYPPFNGINL